MSEQKEILDKVITEWQNTPSKDGKVFDQIDDILVLGFEI